MAGWKEGMAELRSCQESFERRSYEEELPQGILLRNRIHLKKTHKLAATTTNDTQYEQCNEPQPQEPEEPVTETSELLSQSVGEMLTEVAPPTTPVNAPELRRSQCVHRVLKLHENCIVVQVPKS